MSTASESLDGLLSSGSDAVTLAVFVIVEPPVPRSTVTVIVNVSESRLARLGTDQIPLIGVNVGKLGFLAEFSLDELKSAFAQAICDDSLVSRRMMLHVTVTDAAMGEGWAEAVRASL